MRRLLLAALSLLLSLVVVLAIVLGGLLFTTAGARWLADWALEREPRLQLSITGGSLASGLDLEDLSWRDERITFSASAASFVWAPSCLWSRRLCVNSLHLQSPRLVVGAGEASDAEPAQAPQRIELPIAIRLDLLQLADAEFELPGIRGRLPLLQASGGFSDSGLSLGWARIHGLRVVMAEVVDAGAEADDAAPVHSDRGDAPMGLPALGLPFDLRVDGFLLEDAELVVAQRHWPIASLTLNADWRGTELDLRGLQLELPQVQAELRGKIRLEGDYPLQLALRSRLEAAELSQPLQISAELAGSVAELRLKASSAGALTASVSGRVQPLSPRLPFEVQAQWQALGWPLGAESPQLALREGSLQAAGERDAYSVNLDTTVDGEQVPEGRWQLRASGDSTRLRVQQLLVETLGGRLSGSGELGWAGDPHWRAELTAEGIEPERFWPAYPGRLSGTLSSEGAVSAEGWWMQTRTDGIEGRLRGYPLALQGGIGHKVDGSWQFQALRLSSGDNRISADGGLKEQWDLQGEFQLPQLNALLPALSGAANGRFALAGPLRTPDVDLTLAAKRLRYQDYALAGLAVQASIGRLGEAASSLAWQATGVASGERVLGALSGRLTGSREQHRLAAEMDGPQLDAGVVLAGGLADNFDWSGRLLEARVALPPELVLQLAEPVALRWRQTEQDLAIASHCWRQEEARLCLTEPARLGRNGELAVSLERFELESLSPWLPEEADWNGPLTASARLGWQPDAPPRLSLRASSENGTVRLSQDDDQTLLLGYQRLAASVELDGNGLMTALELRSDALGSGRVELHTRIDASPRPLSGEVDLRGLRLDVLKPFLPQLQTVAGALSAKGRLDGSLQRPRFFGEIRLADGALASPNLPLELHEVQFSARVRGDEATLSGRFQSAGEGSGRIKGEASWSDADWRLVLRITGDDLLVHYAPLARLRVDPDLRISVQPKQIDVSGRIVIPRGQITLEELPEGAVEVSDDVVVVRRPDSPEARPTAAEPMPGWTVTMNVELVLGDKVEISGQGLSGRLTGNLNIRQRSGGVPEAVGELRVEDGLYEAYGQELTIRQGQLIFSGPIAEPDLNIEAVREVADVVAGIRVEGSPEDPRATLFSEPGMPQEDILSYIIRGRPLDSGGASSSEQALLAQAALSLGIFGGRGVATSLAEGLGVEGFELGTSGEGEGTQFELSGYLNPDLFVRYGIGVFAPVNTLTLRYRLSKSFFVEAVSSLDNAIDFLYEFRF